MGILTLWKNQTLFTLFETSDDVCMTEEDIRRVVAWTLDNRQRGKRKPQTEECHFPSACDMLLCHSQVRWPKVFELLIAVGMFFKALIKPVLWIRLRSMLWPLHPFSLLCIFQGWIQVCDSKIYLVNYSFTFKVWTISILLL